VVNIYLFLYPKEAFYILKKQKERKRQVQNKKSRTKQKKSEVWLSDFTRAENWSDLACPFVPLGLVQFYQGCELVRFYQG
jgi:hypothetical protein